MQTNHYATTEEQSVRLVGAGVSPASADLYRTTLVDIGDEPAVCACPYTEAVAYYRDRMHIGNPEPFLSPVWSFGRLWDIYRSVPAIARYGMFISDGDAESAVAYLVDAVVKNVALVSTEYRQEVGR